MIALSANLQRCYSPRPSVEETIQWLLELGLPPLPIAPYHAPTLGPYYNIAKRGQPPEAKFTGKGPSYLNSRGVPILVPHSQYREHLPGPELLKRWFRDERVGIATMGGWQNVVWVDVDRKLYDSATECQAQVEAWLTQYGLQDTYYERTQGGGYHIALQVNNSGEINFTRFTFQMNTEEAIDRHRGELLGSYSTVVLAPTIGEQGRYVCLNRARPLWVDSLKSVGIVALLPPGGGKDRFHSFCSASPQPQQVRKGTITLHKLLSRPVQDLLLSCHQVGIGERSSALVKIAREAIGWQNWLLAQGYVPLPDAATLIYRAGERMGLDPGRIERVIGSASGGRPVLHSTPAVYSTGGDLACWRVMRRCNRW